MRKKLLIFLASVFFLHCLEEEDGPRPPRIRPMAPKQVKEGQAISFDLQVSDPNGDPVTVTIVGKSLPNGAYFSGTTFTWAATYEDAGTYRVIFAASTPD